MDNNALRALVDREQPDLVLWRHIHEPHGVNAIGRSLSVNPGAFGRGHYALVEVGDSISMTLD